MKEESPYKCKQLAKKLGSNTEWKRSQENVMATGCKAKFEQNPNLLEFLLKTRGRQLVEARADDKFWGSGLKHNDKKLLGDKWPGKNRLGRILMQVRDELITV